MTSPPQSRVMARLSLAGFLSYWAVLTLLTHYPFPASEREGPKIDKPLHQIAFMLLTLVVCWAWATWRKLRWPGMLALGAVVIAYGALDEITQGLVPRRSPSVADWLADLVGVGFGLAVWWVIPPAWKAALGDRATRERLAGQPPAKSNAR